MIPNKSKEDFFVSKSLDLSTRCNHSFQTVYLKICSITWSLSDIFLFSGFPDCKVVQSKQSDSRIEFLDMNLNEVKLFWYGQADCMEQIKQGNSFHQETYVSRL